MPSTVKVTSQSSEYNVKIRRGLIERLGIEILNLNNSIDNEILLITDENVSSLYLQNVIMNFQQCPKPEGTKLRICELLIESGEIAKNFSTVANLLEKIAALGLSKKCCIVALGGGVVCDSAAWAAGCYMGGVKLVLVPTTLAAMIDSSVGGSAFLNLNAGKNLAGMSCNPSLVLCDVDCLKTLPPEELKSGICEAFKTALMFSEELFRIFERGEVDFYLEKIIEACIKFRANFNSERAKCIGYEIANAIESLSDYKISHSAALAQAIQITAKIGCSGETFQRIINAMKKNNLFVSLNNFKTELIAQNITGGRSIELNILTEIGKCEMKKIEVKDFCR